MAQSRGGTPTGVRATLSRAPHPIDAEVKTLRLSAFRFPYFFVIASEAKQSSRAVRFNRASE